MKNLNQRWINLLTGEMENGEKEFKEILASSKSEILAIMKYRRLQKEQGRGQEIKKYELKLLNAYGEEYLQSCLQELFLEPIENGYIDYLYKVANRKKLTIEDVLDRVYDKHLEDQGLRFLTVVLTI